MLKSLYSGVSGMKNLQTKMDVISNNIANVNTTAFKSGRVKFQDLLSQSVSSAQASGGNRGGVNPQQIGLGAKVGSIDTMMEGGGMQSTGRGLDFAIAGEGFFTVSPDGGATKLYTRDGAFYLDDSNNLVNSSGLKLMGYNRSGDTVTVPVNPTEASLRALTIPQKHSTDGDLQEYSIDASGIIKGTYLTEAGVSSVRELGQISLTTFSNPGGLMKDGGSNYKESNNSGKPSVGEADKGVKGTIQQNFLEMSNVDLANEFTEMIVTSRAYQANSKSITTSDEMIQELINLKR